MKILAIRGKNLASLSSEFEVDFQSEPLASAGLFAITGPTGSGKSTLLDALCLALYEKTPRLTGVGRSGDIPDVGDNGITPSDVRTILRRGAAEGFAEVDFVGSDGVAYRSRWTVRRARSKADGKMQNSEVSLIRILDGQILGDHRKTETLRLIEACIGLSFEQFTRAVLLAQNDFSAFLKASDDDRAELLQTLTGTETFSAISKQAFERMKTEREQLLRLQVQLKDQEPLTPETRAAKDVELQAQSDKSKTLEQQKSVLEEHLRWYQQWDQLKLAETDAALKLEEATREKDAATPRYEQLALVEGVQSSRPLWSEQLRLHQAVEAGAKAVELAKAAMATSQSQVTAHQAVHDAALRQQTLADTAKTYAQAAIDSARVLDASIAAVTPQFEVAAQAHQTAAEHMKTEQSRQTEAQKRMDAAKADLATAQQWLVDNAQLRPLAEGWQRWEAHFAQAQQMIESQSKILAQVSELEETAVASEESVSTAIVTLNKTTKALDADSAQLAILSQECAAVDVEKLVAQKLQLEQDRDQIQTASQLWQRRLETQKQQQLQAGQRQNYADTLAKSDNDLVEGLEAQPLLERELHTAEESLNLATLAASENAESMRAALQPDKECPVCGSLEHPYAVHTPAMDAVLTSLQNSVKTKLKALRDLESSIATARATKASAESSTNQITLALGQLESEIANQRTEWAAHALHAQIDLVPELDRTQWLTQHQDGVRHDIEQLTQQDALYRDTVKRKDAAQAKVNTANIAVAQAKEALSGLDTQHKTGIHALETARNQQSVIVQQLLAVENQIDGAFDNKEWRDPWSQNSGAFVAQCYANALAWTERQASVATLSSNMTALQVGIGACEKACAQATEQLKTQTQARDAVELVLNTYRTDRSALFEGRPVAEVEAAFNAAIQVAKSALAASQTALHQAQVEVTRSMEAARQSETLLEQYRIALLDALVGVEAWLADFNIQSRDRGAQTDLGLNALESLLQIAPEWATGEREALQKIEHSVTTAKAVLGTRSNSRIAHEAEKADRADKAEDEDLVVLQDNLTQLLMAIGSATEALSALKLEIAKDNERLGTSGALRVTIDNQAAVSKVWAQLSDLIGSSDGKKFRNFAQQLTLDILLSYGNQHLQSLTRRYRLQRIKDSLGLLVVDQDMGDEVRSVHSLSGGESFLVSLALALGLASLSSHRVQVESLFIDEGFGSLDADSLGIAMDALDNLQSLGRKVGVISHVQEMTERIGTRVHVQRQSGGLSRIVVC
jgi:exonuclease SbcC